MIGWCTSMERLMDETESIIDDKWESYGDWEELFYINLKNWKILINYFIVKQIRRDIKNFNHKYNILDNIEITSSFFEQVDYNFNFTIKFLGTEKQLQQIVEILLHPSFEGNAGNFVKEDTKYYFDPSYGDACSEFWDSINHRRPKWPPQITQSDENIY